MELYETTSSAKYLQNALVLNQVCQNSGTRETEDVTSKHAEPLLVRQKEAYDGAILLCNSVAFLNLLTFARLTGKTQFNLHAGQLEKVFSPLVRRNPMVNTCLLVGSDFLHGSA